VALLVFYILYEVLQFLLQYVSDAWLLQFRKNSLLVAKPDNRLCPIRGRMVYGPQLQIAFIVVP